MKVETRVDLEYPFGCTFALRKTYRSRMSIADNAFISNVALFVKVNCISKFGRRRKTKFQIATAGY
jgi:hypothetical protein